MKKQIIALIAGLLLSVYCTAQTVNVTFQVHNPATTPVYVFGSWSNWVYWPGNQMTPVGNGYYAATLALPPNAQYEFLYVSGSNPVKEILDPSWTCTNGNPQYTNRVLNLGGSDMTVCYDWASCTTCTVPSSNVAVTFQVHNPDSLPVYVFGSWSNWVNWPGTPMTAVGNGYYAATVFMPSSTNYEYLFVNGNGPTKEDLDPAWPCTNGNGTYTNRTLGLAATDTTLCFEWESCTSCNLPSTMINVMFAVQSPDSVPVYVFGNWNNWGNWPGYQMSTIGGNEWTVNLQLNSNQNIEFLFVNGVGPTKEVLDPSWSCTNGNPTYTNRKATLGAYDTLICGIFSSCNPCMVGLPEIESQNVKINLGTDGLQVFSAGNPSIDRIEIYDLLGRRIYYSEKKHAVNSVIPVYLDAGSLYLVKLKINDTPMTFKSLMTK